MVVAGGAAALGVLVAPEVATGALFAAGTYGAYKLFQSVYSNISSGSQTGLAYDLGRAAGGAAVGGATSYGVRFAITGETAGPSSFLDFTGLTKLTNPFRAGNSIGGNIRAAFAKGPDFLGGGAAIAGGAGFGKAGC